MPLWTHARPGAYCLLFAALLCLGLAACGGDETHGAKKGSPSTSPTVVNRPPTSVAAATATVSAASLHLACTTHTTIGAQDDETQQTLVCTVSHAPTADTRFTLHYSIRDPLGTLRPFTQPCEGALQNGSGWCSSTYTFSVPFAPVPGPVTGETLPSHYALGPVTPHS
jgi:hypothetical protein